MSKGLEALKRIKNTPTYDNGLVKDFHPSCCEIIEKELKALEIIKEKNVHTRAIKMGNDMMTCEFYNKQYAREDSEELTQEEYELLKEVLL